LQAEADFTLGAADVPSDFETASSLAYAGAVANETMRLRPVAPVIFVDNNRDVVVGDVAVPVGTRICLLMRLPALSDEHFSQPDRFLPERWLEHSAPTQRHEVGAHMPFGTGPRICPGRSLALLEMKIVLSALYRAVEVERVGNSADVAEAFAFTMSPTGLKVRLRRRN
jgi:cytochrome P450